MDIGQILCNKYRIIEKIGRGATSEVFLAENISIKNLWAIKAISKTSSYFSTEMKEIQVLKDLSHPMLPRITDYFEDEYSCYIVMDYFSGINLLDYVRQNGPIGEKLLTVWIKQLIDILYYLHNQKPSIIYRDLKPANLIVDTDMRLKLIDFGTVRYSKKGVTEDTVYIGTHGYAAPEQYGVGISDERTDYYNLGMTITHLATGVHPVKLDKENIKDALKNAGLSRGLVKFIICLIDTNPDNRPQSSEELKRHFNKIFKYGMVISKDSDKIILKSSKNIIAITSVIQNCGVTSLCLMLSVFFRKRGYHTIVAELNRSGDFERLKHEFDILCRLDHYNNTFFKAEGLTFYPSVNDGSCVTRNGADIVIQDVGPLYNERMCREFNRADIKLVVCPNVFWKFNYIEEFINKYTPEIRQDWIYTLISCDKQDEQMLRKQKNVYNIVTFPLVNNIFNPSRNDEKIISQALLKAYRLSGQKVDTKRGV